MRNFIVSVVCILLMGAAGWADDSDGPILGHNQLRNNGSVTTYMESDKGIPIYVEGALSDQRAAGDEVTRAIAFFEENRGAYKMVSPADELTVVRTDRDDLGMSHVRLHQNYKGVPVVGADLMAHFTADGSLKTVNGYYYHDINLDVTPVVASDAAVATASEHLKSFFGTGTPTQPVLVVFPWEDQYFLCWRFYLMSDTPMGRWEYFVDAATGEIIYSANRIMNDNDIGTGYGVMGDFRDHIDTDYNGSVYRMYDDTRRLNNNPHGHDGQMPSNAYIQTNIAGGSLPGSIATDADNYWDNVDTQRPAVDGQVYTGLVYDWLLSALGRNGYDDNGSTMLTSVNYYAEGDNNAYWNGSQIVVWSWSTGWRSLAGCPDVIAHEWGHAVTETCSDLVYQKEPGALNESYSDMMGAAFEWAHPDYDVGDWGMGENGRLTGTPFRSMSDPHLYGDPDYYGTSDQYWVDVENCTPSYYNDYCGVHTNSGVGNKWYFLLSDGGVHHGVTVTGIGPADAIRIAYRANQYYWSSNTVYHDAALGTISAANDLDPTGAWGIQVSNAWNAVGVSTPGPSLIFSFPDGLPTTAIPDHPKSFGVVITGSLGGTLVPGSAQIHYSLNGGAYSADALTQLTSTRFNAVLPATSCGDVYDYYLSAEETSTGIKYDPDPSSPITAAVADSIVTVFADDFETDQGWTVSGSVTEGAWERAIPANGGARGDPPEDYDGSGYCYVTDNSYNADIDGGTTYLNSPVIDLSAGDALINYARWYSNDYGSAPHTDTMRVYISNNSGSDWTLVEEIGPVNESSGGWYEHSFWAGDFVTPTSQMKLRFEASDLGDGSVVEAAVDAVSIKSYVCGSPSQPLEIVTDAVPDWTAGYPMSLQLEATGGFGSHYWIDKYDDLAGTGLSLSFGGMLSGTPLSSGPITFTAEVSDDSSNVADQEYSFTINAGLNIVTTDLPDWSAGVPYSSQLSATGGTGSKTWTDQGSNLATHGLTLSSGGLISGTPTGQGTVNVLARITDAVGAYDEQQFAFTINPAVTITTTSVPDWTEGVAYSQQLQADGGTGVKTWSDKYSELSGSGLTLSSTGLLSGTAGTAGPISFTAAIADAIGSTDETLLEFTINPAIAITTDSLPDGELGTAYSLQMEATGGTGAMSWADRDGDLEGTGLALSSDGLLSGTPTVDGEISLVARAEDEVGAFDEQPYTFTITRPYVCGDANGDEDINIGDAVYLIAYIFHGGPAPDPLDAGDANCDGTPNIADAVYLVNYIFNSGPAPCCP
jgi:bacillolysin